MSLRTTSVVATIAISFGGLAGRAVAQTAARAAAAKGAAARPSEAERAGRLAEGLASTAKMIDAARPQHSIQQLVEASREAWTGPYVQRLTACGPLLSEMQKAAQEGRAGDLAQAALQGHLVVDAVYDEASAKTQEHKTAYLQMVIKNDPDRGPLDKAGQDMDMGVQLLSYLTATLDLFDFPLQTVLEHAPSAVQSSIFAAVADGLPQAKPSRARLENMLRLGYEQQADPAARKQAAARLTALNIPLKAPKADAPAAKKPSPGR